MAHNLFVLVNQFEYESCEHLKNDSFFDEFNSFFSLCLGQTMSLALANSGLTSFPKLEQASPRDIEVVSKWA